MFWLGNIVGYIYHTTVPTEVVFVWQYYVLRVIIANLTNLGTKEVMAHHRH